MAISGFLVGIGALSGRDVVGSGKIPGRCRTRGFRWVARALLLLALLPSVVRSQGVGEFHVADGGDPTIAMNSATGELVIAWKDREFIHIPGLGQLEDYLIKARRFDPMGRPLGDVMTIVRSLQDPVREPSVAISSSGGFAVAWVDRWQSTQEVRVQLYDAQGRALTNGLFVDPDASDIQRGSVLVARPGGGYLVVWESDGDLEETIQGRLIDAQGVWEGGGFEVGPGIAGSSPDAGVNAAGEFVVVWRCISCGLEDHDGIAGQKLDAMGAKVGSLFQVNTANDASQKDPAVSFDEDGSFVVVWSDLQGIGDFDRLSIQGQRFDSAGSKLGGQFPVNTFTAGHQEKPDVAVRQEGGFLVAWHSAGSSGSDTSLASIQGRRFDTLGNPSGADFQVNVETYGNQRFPEVATGPEGSWAAVWESSVSIRAHLSAPLEVDLTVDDGVTSAIPGITTLVYTIVVSNPGDPLPSVQLEDDFPEVLDCSWTSTSSNDASGNTVSGSGDIVDEVLNLPTGGSVTYEVSCSIDPLATGTLSNVAMVTVGNLSYSAFDDDTVLADTADLQITKDDGVDAAVAGTTITYTVVASNPGPAEATDVLVEDHFPDELTGCSWTSAAEGGASGNSDGSGNLSQTLALPVGGSVSYDIECTIVPEATGTLSNTATITSSVPDFDLSNNSATDDDTELVDQAADLKVVIDGGQGTAVPGAGALTYTLVASNEGPSAVDEASLGATLPTDFGCSWSSVATAGVLGNTEAGSGDLADTLVLPPSAVVTYTIDCLLGPDDTGTLQIETQIESSVRDPLTTNNQDSYTTTLLPSADLSVELSADRNSMVPGDTTPLIYTLSVANAGPSSVAGAALTDFFPEQLSCTWTSQASGNASGNTSGSGFLEDSLDLPPSGAIEYTVSCTLDPGASGELNNTASLALPDGVDDPDLTNNTKTLTTSLEPEADLAITKDNGVNAVVEGQSVVYTIEVSNAGPSAVLGAQVHDLFPPELTCTWVCVGSQGGRCASGSRTGALTDSVDLPAGGIATYTALCTVGALSDALENTATVSAPVGTHDPDLGNNTATDIDDPSIQLPFTEMFSSTGSLDSHWVLGGSAQLESGWLSLTEPLPNQRGWAILDAPLPSARGLSVVFNTLVGAGTGGNGLTVFFLDGGSPAQPGGSGPCLGYSAGPQCAGSGVPNAYVGIGFDELGEFSSSGAGSEGPGPRPDHVVLRGSGNGSSGYPFLTSIEVPEGVTGGNAVRLWIADQKITVETFPSAEGPQPLVHQFDLAAVAGQASLPETLKIGFAATTGADTNYHLIDNLVILAHAVDTEEGAWSEVEPMGSVRSLHTQTLLLDGRVLAVGGTGGLTSEIFDPATGRWSPTGDLAEAMSGAHTTTLLPSGKVLALDSASAQIYDPANETWSITQRSTTPRIFHTATLLPSGKVLVAGGYDSAVDGSGVPSVEIFDPVDEQWSHLTDLAEPRRFHTATLARDGTVWIAGGEEGGSLRTTVEQIDPESGDPPTVRVADLGSVFDQHTMTQLADGKFFLAGGLGPEPVRLDPFVDPVTVTTLAPETTPRLQSRAALLPSGRVLVSGGLDDPDPQVGQSSALAEVYDPNDNLWRSFTLGSPRSGHGMTLLPSGGALASGGRLDLVSSSLASSEIFWPGDGHWTTDSTFDSSLGREDGHTATLLPTGEVLVVGGRTIAGGALQSADLYDPRMGSWTPVDDSSASRQWHTATLLPARPEAGVGARVLIVGGDLEGGTPGDVVLYDPTTGWLSASSTGLSPRRRHTATLLADGRVLVLGGETDGGPVVAAQVYDPASDTWSTVAPPRVARVGHTATLLPTGQVLLLGGKDDSGAVVTTAEIYDPSTGLWRTTQSPGDSRSQHTATLLPSGEVLLASGLLLGGGLSTGAELFDPEAEAWRQTGALGVGRFRHTATLLGSGRVLVTGGQFDVVTGPQTSEIYDPASGTWSSAGQLPYLTLADHTTTLLPSGEVLLVALGAQRYDPRGVPAGRARPTITRAPTGSLRYDQGFEVVGTGFTGDSEAADGTAGSSVGYPLVQLHSLENDRQAWLVPRPRDHFLPDDPDGTMTLRFGDTDGDLPSYYDLPAIFDPGWHRLTVVAAGVPSESALVHLDCSLEVGEPRVDALFDATGQPIAGPEVPVGGRVRFAVETRGGRRFQWQKNTGDPATPLWVDVDDAEGATYLTPPLSGLESGTEYRVRVSSGCTTIESSTVTFAIEDLDAPDVLVVSPNGGEYWVLSTDQGQNVETVSFEVSDPTTWVCDLQISLRYSNDGGETWHEAPSNVDMPSNTEGELPRLLGDGGRCSLSRAVASGTLTYTVPHEDNPPSGQPGSLYKIRLEATDHAGNTALAESPNPFFIVAPNDESIKTLILAYPERLGVDCGANPEPAMCRKLRELADHPKVAGIVDNLKNRTNLGPLYEAWDAADALAKATGDPADRAAANDAANDVLFNEFFGIQQRLRGLLAIYPAVESVMLIGGDSVIPMARVPDRSGLLLESAYAPQGVSDPDLVRDETRVARALAENTYLSDDPLMALLDPVQGPQDLKTEGVVFIPDLLVGRLVETPAEIVAAIANFQEYEGVLALHERSHQVLVTGYDFLTDSANVIAENWRCTLDPDDSSDTEDSVCAPGPGQVEPLIGAFSQSDLQDALCGRSVADTLTEPYGLINLNGHANHYLEGIPSSTGNHFDIEGLDAATLDGPDACGSGTPLDLQGAMIYAVGCHGGLPVDDQYTTTDDPPMLADTTNALDLPQVFLERGAMAYIANSGYGWGLKDGIGYGERLLEIFTDQLRIDDSIKVGEAVRAAKLRYYQEARSLDAYGIKTLMQWTIFGFPMARLELREPPDDPPDGGGTQQQALAHLRPITGPAPRRDELAAVERIGPVTVRREFSEVGAKDDDPPHLDSIGLEFDFSDESWVKRQADGTVVPLDEPGCPEGSGGCYYTLNGLGERGSGETDRPIQPFFVLDSRLAGTSQHGVLWLGGSYVEEADWQPIFASLISNTEAIGDTHGSAPQFMLGEPVETPLPQRSTSDGCTVTDLEINTMIVPMGEVRQGPDGTGGGPVVPELYTIQRRYIDLDLEILYFNDLNTNSTANCDRDGPEGLEPGEGPFDGLYHTAEGSTLHWQVPVAAPDAGPDAVWRVVVVYDARDTLEAAEGAWQPLELQWDPAAGAWAGSQSFSNGQIVTYVIQAVDTRGNVSWMRFVQEELPPDESGASSATKNTTGATDSGVDPRHPDTVPVEIGGVADLSVGLVASPNPVVVDLDLDVVVSVSNPVGPDTATSLLVDFVPFPGSTVLAAGGESWTCVTDAAAVQCQRATLGVGESTDISIFLKAPAQAGDATATVAVRSAERDDSLDDNADEAMVTVIDPLADVALRLTESVDPVVAGTGFGNLQHTLEVENLGPDTATGLVVGVDLPLLPGVMVEAVLPSVGGFDLASGDWTVGGLAADGLAELLVVYTVDAMAVAGTDAVVTSASVKALVERDPEPSNDTASVATSIVDPRGVDLGLELVDRPDPVATGTEMTLEVQVSNLGPGRAVGHDLTIELPDDVTLVELADGDDWDCTTDDTLTPPGITCTGVDLAEGANAAPITLNLTVPDTSTVLEFLARVDWTTWDPATEALVPRAVEVTERTVVERPWRSAPSLTIARRGHTATLLPSGELLVVGGRADDGSILASVEIYDPAARRWRSAAPLTEVRTGHAALLLPDGGVMVAGGRGLDPQPGDEVALRSVERYDPASDAWSPMPSLQVARFFPTLTLLADGSLLVVGSEDPIAAGESAEVLALGGGEWVLTSPMMKPRGHHTSTLLRNGEVLVVGGVVGSTDVEVYDPVQRSWRSVQGTAVERGYHTATLLADGRVLVTGGTERVTEVYDPATETWTAVAKSLEVRRGGHSATSLADGRVLVAGGWQELISVSDTTEIYDPGSDTWMRSSNLEVAREGHSATLLPTGQVVLTGGNQSPLGQFLHSVEIFGEPTARGSEPPQTEDRAHHSATLLTDGSVLATGGVGGDGPSAFVSRFRADSTWMAEPPLLAARRHHTQTVLSDGRVLVTGGYGESQAGAPVIGHGVEEVYDPVSATWETILRMQEVRYHHTATLLTNGSVWIAGGEVTDSILPTRFFRQSTDIFDPSCDCIAEGPNLPVPLSHHTATLLESGKVLVAGGENGGGPVLDAYLYDPVDSGWTQVAPMNGPRSRHSAVLLASGMVLVVGGEGLGAEVYDPDSNAWFLTGEQPAVRSDEATLTTLPSGLVLLVGRLEDGSGRLGAQVYDPVRDSWSWVSGDFGRQGHTVTPLADGRVLILGGEVEGGEGPEFAAPQSLILDLVPPGVRRPVLTEWPARLDFLSDSELEVVGVGFRGVSEGSGGAPHQSSTAYPLVHLQALNGGPSGWLRADPAHPIEPGEDFWDGSMTLDIASLPPVFHPGWHRLTVFAGGVPSHSAIVGLDCSLEVEAPQIGAIFDATGSEIAGPRVPVGGWVRFEVATRGGRQFQWQRNTGSPEDPDWVDLPGATTATYTTPPLLGVESGSEFRVEVSSGCAEALSETVIFTIDDQDAPAVSVTNPNGGEYWSLSTTLAQNVEQVVFEVTDPTTWVCGLRAALIYSNDQGATWHEAPANTDPVLGVDGELPRQLGEDLGCSLEREVLGGTLSYEVPLEGSPPSGQPGSLYKIRLLATDHAGNTAVAESTHPFFIVPPDDQSVRTLVLFHPERLGVDCGADPEPEVCRKVRELADNPQVAGRVVDLSRNEDLEALYTRWDLADQTAQTTGDEGDRDAANQAANEVLFAPGGLQEVLLDLVTIFGEVESVMMIGDDRVIPMARVPDRSGLLGERAYTDGNDPDLAPNDSTVGRAIDGGFYLSDDPLVALVDPVRGPSDVVREGVVFLPDLAVGRLVETPAEIAAAIANFQQREGVLDLTARSKKVLVTGYDFLTDSARSVEEKWRCSFDRGGGDAEGTACDPPPGTIDASLLGQGYGDEDLRLALCGDGEPYGLISLNGHANHFLEGVPGETHFDIQGLETEILASATACDGQPLDLGGAVIYAVGCHGGLSVPDDGGDEESLDLPQVMLGRGALAYIANSGYGWGLREGIGYGERMQEIFTDQLRIGEVTVGRAVLDAKRRYFQEARGLDNYGIKTLMQWTTYGFPMARINTGLGVDETTAEILRPIRGPAPHREDLPTVETVGPMTIHRSFVGGGASEGGGNPPHLDFGRLTLVFSEASYVKRTAEGDRVAAGVAGCPSENGCFYTLNGLGERGTGDSDRPIQPFTVLDARLAGTSQHGVLWLGGEYREEADWRPIFAELISNSEETGSNHGSAPQFMLGEPVETPFPPRALDPECRVSDLEVNTMVIPVGEVRQGPDGSGAGPVTPADYTIQRRYLSVDVEMLYFNNFDDPSQNCDREGPTGLEPGDGPYDGDFHTTNGSTVHWQVPVSDDSGVWRVLVVYDVRDTLEAEDGSWQPLELEFDPVVGAWTGSRSFASGQSLAYVLQAADKRGNVSLMRYGGVVAPPGAPGETSSSDDGGTSSGVDPQHPETVEVEIGGAADLAVTLAASPNPVAVGESLELVVGLSHQGGDSATAVEVEILPFAGSTIVAVGDAQWSCGTDGDRILCHRSSLAPGADDQIVVTLVAPTEPGPGVATARVRSAETDPDGDDNLATVGVTVVEPDLPPRVARVDTAARVVGGALADGVAVDVALTQLRVVFDEPVSEADDPDHFLLVEAGVDGILQTESLLVGVAGDDVALSFDEVTYEPQTRTTVLGLPDTRPLPRGRYVLLVGNGIYDDAFQFLDGNGDGNEGGDFQRYWRVERQHRVVNPNFDRSLAHWTPVGSPNGVVEFHALDSEGVPSSGSGGIQHFGGLPGSYAVGQCVPVTAGERLAFGARLWRDVEDPWQVLELHAEVWSSPDCGETPLNQAATEALEVEPGGDGEAWVQLPLGLIEVPEGGSSLLLALVAAIGDGEEPAEIRLDNVELYPLLFADGFETGDTSRWSRVVDE